MNVILPRPHFAAELFDMGIDGPGITEIVVIPDIVENLLAGKRNARILDKISQKFKFLEGKFHRFAVGKERTAPNNFNITFFVTLNFRRR